jgi:hypothetical protein
MTNHSTTVRELWTPWAIVRERFFGGRSPGILAFAAKHGLDAVEVLKLFSGEVITFSPKMCTALHKETPMTEQFFRNLSNSWRPQLPPAQSAALSPGPFSFL